MVSFTTWCATFALALLRLTHGASLSFLQVAEKRKRTSQAPAPFFEDVTPYAFPKEWYNWNHSGFPRSHQGTPTFFDLNNDGVLDYLYHNHYEADPTNAWDMGLSHGVNRKADDGPAFFRSVGKQLLKCSEPENSKWKQEKSMDTHGTAVLDLDRDGFLDIYMAVGGGDGIVAGPPKNAVLMWGEKGDGALQHFVGGRDASEEANLHNPDSRGRFNYFVDFNQDGLLDVVYSNEPRGDDINAYGYAMINNGDRTFTTHKELSEYTETMILTDADGDGDAAEFIVQRRDCTPKKCHYNMNKQCTVLKNEDPDWYNFCLNRPEDTVAIYKWDPLLKKLVNIAPPTYSKDIGADDHAMSMQSGDFDGDGFADLAVLYPSAIRFYYSKKRQNGELPIGEPHEELAWDKTECTGVGLRAGDLDLDGKQELLVLCFEVKPESGPTHRLYTQLGGNWMPFENKDQLGALRNTGLVHPDEAMMASACKGDVAHFPGYLRKGCTEYKEGVTDGHYGSPRSMGMSLVDWNNDGFLDLALAYDFGKMLLLQNNYNAPGGAAENNHFVAIKLVGTVSNQYGIGATVILRAKNMGEDETEDFIQLREVYSASHETDWYGTRDDRIIFGLGAGGVPVSLTVRWPGKDRQEQTIDAETLKSHLNSMTNLLVVTEPGAN